MTGQKPRQIAARVLSSRSATADYVEDILDRELAKANLSPSDRSLAQELVYGTLRWERTLDWLIARKTEGKAQKPMLALLLRLGLYQMFWLSRVPDHASINVTVELARSFGFDKQTAFINAVLRAYGRERDQTRALLEDQKKLAPALGYSHPDWLFERWEKHFGREMASSLMEWNNSPAPVYARVNRLKTTPEELEILWQGERVKFERKFWPWSTGDFYKIDLPGNVLHLDSFERGFFYIQDPSTAMAVKQVSATPGKNILDLCAAPGGKTTLLAQLMENQGKIDARDISRDRLHLLDQNCKRLGVTCVDPSLINIPRQTGPFDSILIDAPCSNTGVLRRRVELRWRISGGELQRLQKTQKELLKLAAPQLKGGGRLIYSTCSLEPEENIEMVESFLADNPDFSLHDALKLNPVTDQVDGAFVAVLLKG